MFSDTASAQSCALFLFAHQDDEFGVFQTILDEQKNGRRVLCVYLTDGAFKGQSSIRRNRESLAVLGKLGVQEDCVLFAGHTLAIPDGALPNHLEAATDWVRLWLSAHRSVSAIYLPAWEGGHQDHDALHAIGVIVAAELGLLEAVRQFPLYNGYQCGGPVFRVLLPLPINGDIELVRVTWANRLRFLRFCMSYPSQIVTWLGLFPFVLLHYVFYGTQALQAVSCERIRNRPHRGPLYYERRQFYTWEKMSARLFEWTSTRRKTN